MWNNSSTNSRMCPPLPNGQHRCASSNSGPAWQVGPGALLSDLIKITSFGLSKPDSEWLPVTQGIDSKDSGEIGGLSCKIIPTPSRGWLRLRIVALKRRNGDTGYMRRSSEWSTMPAYNAITWRRRSTPLKEQWKWEKPTTRSMAPWDRLYCQPGDRRRERERRPHLLLFR